MTRGGFDSAYAVPNAARYERIKGVRLMDCLLHVVGDGDKDYLTAPGEDEFVVVDKMTRARAFFECLPGMKPERITEMVDSHFFTASIRVAQRVWVA